MARRGCHRFNQSFASPPLPSPSSPWKEKAKNQLYSRDSDRGGLPPRPKYFASLLSSSSPIHPHIHISYTQQWQVPLFAHHRINFKRTTRNSARILFLSETSAFSFCPGYHAYHNTSLILHLDTSSMSNKSLDFRLDKSLTCLHILSLPYLIQNRLPSAKIKSVV